MKSRKYLMIAHTFPPMAAPGAFRALRFVSNLPQHGWCGLVITVKPEAVKGEARDEVLCELVPPSVVVSRTSIWRPIDTVLERVARIFRRRPRKSGDQTKTAPGEQTTVDQSPDGTNMSSLNLQGLLRQIRDLVCFTPDVNVGWIAPAVISGWRLAGRHRPQAIVATGPPQSSYLIAILLKLLTGLPVVLDFRDPWARPEWRTYDLKIRQHLQRVLERVCVRLADRVVLNTARLKNDFVRYYPAAWRDKFALIPNGFDECLQRQVGELRPPTDPAPRNGRLRLCHPGTVYGNRDLSPLVGAIGQLVQSGHEIAFDQIGEIDNPPNVEAYLRERNLEQEVRIRGRLPHDKTLGLMASADVLVVIQPGTTLQVPAKLFEMLLFRKPILALTEDGATSDIIKEYGIGVVADPFDSAAIAAAIEQVANLAKDEASLAGWDRALEAFDGRCLTAELAKVLDGCASKSMR